MVQAMVLHRSSVAGFSPELVCDVFVTDPRNGIRYSCTARFRDSTQIVYSRLVDREVSLPIGFQTEDGKRIRAYRVDVDCKAHCNLLGQVMECLHALGVIPIPYGENHEEGSREEPR